MQAADGNFYGTTDENGAYGAGSVFKMTPGGTLTTRYSFCSQPGCPDGSNPSAKLLQASDGNLYGTTSGMPSGTGYGTVFKMTPGGRLTTLYSFCGQPGCPDRANPTAKLVQASDGSLYGTTSSTIFKITPDGSLSTLYSFCGQPGCPDGAIPSGLTQASDGNFYGTTLVGGASNCGTIFKISSEGTLTTLYSFAAIDGTYPYGGLVQATDGSFYGVTREGGTGNYGTVFRLSVGLRAFVKTLPHSGKVGAVVNILGTNLTGTTSVSFNRTPAEVTIVSPSQITTSVPAGATNGTVQVITPAGTLMSNMPFRVR